VVRLNDPCEGLHRPLKYWRPTTTHHCLCGYAATLGSHNAQLRAHMSGLLTH
jgi:hypothetical protein